MQHTPFPYPEIKKIIIYDYFCREGSARQWTSGLPLGSLRGPRRWSEWQRWAAHLSAAPGGAGGGGWPLQPLLGNRLIFLIVINCEIVVFIKNFVMEVIFFINSVFGAGAECNEDPEPNNYFVWVIISKWWFLFEDPEPIYVRIRSRDINCINNNKFVIIVLGSLVELCTRDLLYLLIIITELIVGIRSRIVGSGYIFLYY